MPIHTPPTEAERPLGRRERSKQRVKQAIYGSALALFAEQGYDGTTIDQIAERADVARGTFFNYFQRKEDLVTAWAERRGDRLNAIMEESLHATDDVTVHLERCMATLAQLNEEERDITPVMLAAWVKAGRPLDEDPYTASIFTTIIELGKRQGRVAPDIDSEQVGHILRDCYLGALYRWSPQDEGKPPLHVELRAILRVVLTGVLGYREPR
ncbi:TetR/AcrR family transcriptional regulator [Streptomyces sp. NPDC003943]